MAFPSDTPATASAAKQRRKPRRLSYGDELRAAREEHAATAEILEIINSSGADLKANLEAILGRATHLSEATYATVLAFDGERLAPAAVHGDPWYIDSLSRLGPQPLVRGTPVERALRGERVVVVADTSDDAAIHWEPLVRELRNRGRIHSALYLGVRKDNNPLGVLALYRPKGRPSSGRQKAVLRQTRGPTSAPRVGPADDARRPPPFRGEVQIDVDS